MTDDWATPVDDPTRFEKPHRRHVWGYRPYRPANLTGTVSVPPIGMPLICLGCGRIKDEAASRRGRTSRRAGNDAERHIAKAYGGTRTGQFGGPDDVTVGDMFVIQSKAGGWFSERVWAELVKLGGSTRIPTLIVSDRPGPGHRTRRYVIRSIEDDIALHGRTIEEALGVKG